MRYGQELLQRGFTLEHSVHDSQSSVSHCGELVPGNDGSGIRACYPELRTSPAVKEPLCGLTRCGLVDSPSPHFQSYLLPS